MPAKKYKVGLEIDAWCTKCKVDRLHVIQTLKSDGNIDRVQCRTCDGVHLFRRPKGEGKGAKTTTKRRKKADAAVTEAEAAKAKPYAMDGEFAAAEVIQHARFGLGRVTEVRAGGKMEVAFEEGLKILLCKDTVSLLARRRPSRAAKKAEPKPEPPPKTEEDGDEKDAAEEAGGEKE